MNFINHYLFTFQYCLDFSLCISTGCKFFGLHLLMIKNKIWMFGFSFLCCLVSSFVAFEQRIFKLENKLKSILEDQWLVVHKMELESNGNFGCFTLRKVFVAFFLFRRHWSSGKIFISQSKELKKGRILVFILTS